jgi:hypothetical protein
MGNIVWIIFMIGIGYVIMYYVVKMAVKNALIEHDKNRYKIKRDMYEELKVNEKTFEIIKNYGFIKDENNGEEKNKE